MDGNQHLISRILRSKLAKSDVKRALVRKRSLVRVFTSLMSAPKPLSPANSTDTGRVEASSTTDTAAAAGDDDDGDDDDDDDDDDDGDDDDAACRILYTVWKSGTTQLLRK